MFEGDVRQIEVNSFDKHIRGQQAIIVAPVENGCIVADAVNCFRMDSVGRRLADAFRQELKPAWRVLVPLHPSGGTLCIPLGADQPRVAAALRAAGVHFDSRGDVVRLSFHACNEIDDALTVARAWNGVH